MELDKDEVLQAKVDTLNNIQYWIDLWEEYGISSAELNKNIRLEIEELNEFLT